MIVVSKNHMRSDLVMRPTCAVLTGDLFTRIAFLFPPRRPLTTAAKMPKFFKKLRNKSRSSTPTPSQPAAGPIVVPETIKVVWSGIEMLLKRVEKGLDGTPAKMPVAVINTFIDLVHVCEPSRLIPQFFLIR